MEIPIVYSQTKMDAEMHSVYTNKLLCICSLVMDPICIRKAGPHVINCKKVLHHLPDVYFEFLEMTALHTDGGLKH